MRNFNCLVILTLILIQCDPGVRNSGSERKFTFSTVNFGNDSVFQVILPETKLPIPAVPVEGREPGFRIRGMKGYCWTPEQYLQEIPILAEYKGNFLMNCYLSMFTAKKENIHSYDTFLDSLDNEWWLPLNDKKKSAYEKVFAACTANHIDFCFAMNPQLFSRRPLDPRSDEDFNLIWKHYEWAQQHGVRWFSVCLDDVQDGNVAIIGREHALFVNKLIKRLRMNDPDAQVIFCPTWYWGTGTNINQRSYLEELGEILHPDIYVFWTGPQVVPTRIRMKEAQLYKELLKHRLILWENYPVNDNHPTMHLGPVTGRDKDLCEILDGYMVNPLGTQNEINRLPLLTCLDYAYNPRAYDPVQSIGQSILHLAETTEQQEILAGLVDAYPGSLILRTDSSDRGLVGFNPVRYHFQMKIIQDPAGKAAGMYLKSFENLLEGLRIAFPGQHQSTAAVVENDIQWMKERLDYNIDRVLLLKPGPGNARNSEGDFIHLRDGRILFIYTHFTDGMHDFAKAYFAGRYSSDGGKTWTTDDVIILPNEGKANIMSCSLLRLKDHSIALFYLVKNSDTDCRLYVRFSQDETKSWTEPVLVINDRICYAVVNNDRVIQLSGGRIIAPAAVHNTPEKNRLDKYGDIVCYFSDDNGKSWKRSTAKLRNKSVILQEPGIVELGDGRLMMYCRTDAGYQYISNSSDQGDTWNEMIKSGISSFMSPAVIKRIPSTGDLVLVWNYRDEVNTDIINHRSPLCIAVSPDDGKTWSIRKVLESNPKNWYCYPSVEFDKGNILLGYCAGSRETGNGLQSLQVTRIPVEWLYHD